MVGGSDMYRQQILDHYKSPRNYGELEDPTYTHVGENPMCGDTIEMQVKLDDDEETIEHVAFQGDGCAISQASASMLSEKLAGMSGRWTATTSPTCSASTSPRCA
jgi:nitrogen fixation NifU-like protein